MWFLSLIFTVKSVWKWIILVCDVCPFPVYCEVCMEVIRLTCGVCPNLLLWSLYGSELGWHVVSVPTFYCEVCMEVKSTFYCEVSMEVN